MEQTGTNLKTRAIAARLLGYEAAAQPRSETDTSTCSRVCQKLGQPLSKLVGTEGFGAILARALVLAKREAEGLNAVNVTDAGSLEGMNGEAEKVSAVLVAHVIGLLLAVLGESLTLRVVHDVWREQTDSDRRAGPRGGHERTQ